MSYANVRAGIVSIVESMTPTTTTRGNAYFFHVDGAQIEDDPVDRHFVVRMSSPPAQIGQVINGVSWRYTVGVEVTVFYARGRLVEEDEDRISEDAEMLSRELLVMSNHSSNVCGLIGGGDGYISTAIEEDDERNYWLSLSLTVHYV